MGNCQNPPRQVVPSFNGYDLSIPALNAPVDIPINPFPSWNVIGFNQEDILSDLNCQICLELAVEPRECSNCNSLFCKLCINDWNKKNPITKCAFCNQSPWNLQQKHRLYSKMLDRLEFKCNAPFCKGKYTINNFPSHQHDLQLSMSILVEYHLKDTEGVVTLLDSYLCDIIEKQRKTNQKAKFIQYYRVDTFEFDLSTNAATRVKDQKKYSLHKKDLKESKQHDQFRWVWKDNDKNNWKAYTVEDNKQIEEAYMNFLLNHEQNSKFSFNLSMVKYTIDFKTWKQINEKTSFVREVYRCKEVEKKRFQ